MPTVNCYSCGGSGVRTCTSCFGRKYEYRLNFKGEQEQRLCGHCGGRGGTPCDQCSGSGQLPIETRPEPSLEEPVELEPYDVRPEIEKGLRNGDPELYKAWQESPGTQQVVIEAAQLGYFTKFVLNKGANDKTYRLKLDQAEWLMTPSSPYGDPHGTFRDYTQAVRERGDDDFRRSRHTAARNKQGQYNPVHDDGEEELDLSKFE